MHQLDDEAKKEVFGEAILDELKVIHEYVEQIPGINKRLDKVEDRLEGVETRLELLEDGQRQLTAAVLEHMTELDEHDRRITRLEHQAG